jgi:hypothetical protein
MINEYSMQKKIMSAVQASNLVTYLTTFTFSLSGRKGNRISRAGPELQFCYVEPDLNGYPHVRCEAVTKGFGMPTQCQPYWSAC